jgi:protein TonB
VLDDFSASNATDVKRLGASLAASVALYGAVATGVVLASAVVRHVAVEEELLTVTFAPPPAPEPPPPPPPPPPPAAAEPPPPAPAPAARLGQRRPELAAPAEIPDEAPRESDAPLSPPDAPFAPENEGDPNGSADGVLGGVAGGRGGAPVQEAAPAPPAAPEPARATGPMRVPEGGTSPQPLDTSVQPQIPEALRASGLTTVRIVVRVVVAEDGSVRECTVLRGHPLMPDENVVRAVSAWRFSPGRTSDGQSFVAIHTLPITFRISL